MVKGLTSGPGLSALRSSLVSSRFRARVRFMARHFPDDGWPDLSDETLLATLGDWLGPHLEGVRRLADVARHALLPIGTVVIATLGGWEPAWVAASKTLPGPCSSMRAMLGLYGNSRLKYWLSLLEALKPLEGMVSAVLKA